MSRSTEVLLYMFHGRGEQQAEVLVYMLQKTGEQED
jgi:hypothetical protein